jgi:hypothetical protein
MRDKVRGFAEFTAEEIAKAADMHGITPEETLRDVRNRGPA